MVVPNLSVRVSDRGCKTFVVGARFPNANHYVRRALGSVDDLSLAEARALAREWLAQVSSGVDPQRPLAPTEVSFGEVAESLHQARVSRGKRTGRRTAMEIRKELVKPWGQRCRSAASTAAM